MSHILWVRNLDKEQSGDASVPWDKVRGGTRWAGGLVCRIEVASFPFQWGWMEGWLQLTLSTASPATRATGQTSSVATQGWKSGVPENKPETAAWPSMT